MRRSLLGGSFAIGVFALALAGCGDSAPDDPTLRFVGTWQYDLATSKVTCPGADPLDTTPRGNKVIARGTMHDLVDLTVLSSSPKIFCNFGFDIVGPEATAPTGQGCALLGTDIFTLSAWTFSLTGPDKAEEVASGDHAFTIQGMTTHCQYDLSATLNRVAKD